MNDGEELPSWAGRALQTGVPPAQHQVPEQPLARELPPHDDGGGSGGGARMVIVGLVALLVLAAAGVAGFLLTRGGEEVATDAATATTQVAAPATDAGAADGSTDGSTEAADPAPTTPITEATTTTEAPTTTETGVGLADGQLLLPDDFVPSDPNYEARIAENPRYTVVRGGIIHLYGFVPTQEVLDEIVAVVEGVGGPQGYVVETFVDPDAPLPPGAPVYVDDRVLFGFNSVAIEPEFIPVLELGTLLLSQNPDITIEVTARTDATGSAEVNLEVSRQRGQAVVNYWAGRGIDPARITVNAVGEADASENDDDLTAALNRSVDFLVIGAFEE